MPQINKLTAASAVVGGDLLAAYINSQGDTRKVSMTALLAYMQSNLSFTSVLDYTSQYSSPNATGFSVPVTDGASNNTSVHLILTPFSSYAAGTIVLPAVAGCVDKQEVLVNSTRQVTTLTINGNGAANVFGDPSTISADGFFRLKFDIITKNWYRVG